MRLQESNPVHCLPLCPECTSQMRVNLRKKLAWCSNRKCDVYSIRWSVRFGDPVLDEKTDAEERQEQ